MSHQLSYAGIALSAHTPEVIDLLNGLMPLDCLRETVPVPSWPGRQMMALAYPEWPKRPPLRLGEFFYPTGVSRWGECHLVARRDQVTAIEHVALAHGSGGGSQAETFTMYADPLSLQGLPSGNYSNYQQFPLSGFLGPMHMLAARPVAELIPNLANPALDGLYILTLVDDRYFGFASSAFLFPAGVQGSPLISWNAMITTLAAYLNINITTDGGTVDTALYGYPNSDSSFWASEENASFLLDAAAWNVGRVVVRSQGGTYKLVLWTDATSTTPGPGPAGRPPYRTAGGGFFDYFDQAGLYANIEAVCPQAVGVTFPKYLVDAGFIDARPAVPAVKEMQGDVFSVKVLLKDAGVTNEFASYTGHPGTKFFHDTAKAYYLRLTDSNPQNLAQLQALAKQIATDYYYGQLGARISNQGVTGIPSQYIGLDEVYPGIYNFGPDQFHDILWTYQGGGFATTRVMRKPWNFGVQELQHWFAPPTNYTDGPNCSPCNEVFKLLSGPDQNNHGLYTMQRWRLNTALWQWEPVDTHYSVDPNNPQIPFVNV